MMRTRAKSATLGVTKTPALIPVMEIPTAPAAVTKKFSSLDIGKSPPQEVAEWEVRPGGMLVQKRDPDADAVPPPPPIRVRVKYASAYHEIYISPQATFGELKKMLSAKTGLHPQDQKVLFKDKERDSNAYLDISGVKDRSKMVVVEDPAGQAKRFLEQRKSAKLEKAAKSVSQISHEVDKLAGKVSALETIVSKGKKVAENDVLSLTEQLMNQLIKLDGIVTDGDVKLQRRIQVKRVQKYVETLDVLKIKNAMPVPTDNLPVPQQQQQKQQHHQQKTAQVPAVVTTNWETFDLLSSMPSTSSASSTTSANSFTTTTTTSSTAGSAHAPRFEWELF